MLPNGYIEAPNGIKLYANTEYKITYYNGDDYEFKLGTFSSNGNNLIFTDSDGNKIIDNGHNIINIQSIDSSENLIQ